MFSVFKKLRKSYNFYITDPSDKQAVIPNLLSLYKHPSPVYIWKNLMAFIVVDNYLRAVIDDRVDHGQVCLSLNFSISHDNEDYRVFITFEVRPYFSEKNNSTPESRSQALSFINSHLMKNPIGKTKLEFYKIKIDRVVHEETENVIMSNIPILSKVVYEGTIRNITLNMERYCSMFNDMDKTTCKEEIISYLTDYFSGIMLSGDMLNISAGIISRLVQIPSSMTNGLDFSVNDWKFIHTNTCEATYDNMKSLPDEYLLNDTTKKYLVCNSSESDGSKLLNLIKLKGMGNEK